ncbi:mitochondrial ubiquitin ligase activator of nfkb 1-A-like isoform 2-T2 [Discoglossus pictus]
MLFPEGNSSWIFIAAQIVPQNTDVRKLLESSDGQELGYVALEGTVEAISSALPSQSQPDLQAVIQKHQVIEHRLLWNSLTQSWSECERVLHENVNSVPFCLCVQEFPRDYVVICEPLNASGLVLQTVHERFHAPSPGFGELMWHYMSGEKPKGLLEKEEILAVGATLTGLGRLTLDAQGVLILEPPKDGSEYFLSLDGYEGIVDQQESVANFWKNAALFCGVLGATLLCISLYRAYCKHREKKEEEEDIRRSVEESRGEPQVDDGSQEDEGRAPGKVCVICLAQPRECVILPCGHVCCCFSCYQALPAQNCPICRCHIDRVVPLY